MNKQVTLKMGVVVTSISIATVNGKPDPNILICQARDGNTYCILRRVIEELPVTYNREEL